MSGVKLQTYKEMWGNIFETKGIRELLNIIEAQDIWQKLDVFDYIKVKDFSPVKDPLNKAEKWVTAWKTLALSKYMEIGNEAVLWIIKKRIAKQ